MIGPSDAKFWRTEFERLGLPFPAAMAEEIEAIDVREEKLAARESPPHNEVGTTERNSLLKLVYGVAVAKYGYDPSKSRNQATGENFGSIHADLAMLGLDLDRKTIARYLDEALETLGDVIDRETL